MDKSKFKIEVLLECDIWDENDLFELKKALNKYPNILDVMNPKKYPFGILELRVEASDDAHGSNTFGDYLANNLHYSENLPDEEGYIPSNEYTFEKERELYVEYEKSLILEDLDKLIKDIDMFQEFNRTSLMRED